MKHYSPYIPGELAYFDNPKPISNRKETEILLQQKDWRLGKKDFENVSLEMEGNSKGSTDNSSYSPMSMI